MTILGNILAVLGFLYFLAVVVPCVGVITGNRRLDSPMELVDIVIGATTWHMIREHWDPDHNHATHPTLLSDEQFAERCRELATPHPEPQPQPPEPLPLELRDTAFQRRAHGSPRFNGRCRVCGAPTPGAFCSDRCQVTAYGTDWKPLPPRPVVTDRVFEAYTHCPAGHLGWHWIGDHETVDDGQVVVHRSCRWDACPETWAEPAH